MNITQDCNDSFFFLHNTIRNNTAILLLFLTNDYYWCELEERIGSGDESRKSRFPEGFVRSRRTKSRRVSGCIERCIAGWPLRFLSVRWCLSSSLSRSLTRSFAPCLPPSRLPSHPCPRLSFFERILIARADKRTSRESGATNQPLAVVVLASNSFQPPPLLLIL